jgi:hypothetical protein
MGSWLDELRGITTVIPGGSADPLPMRHVVKINAEADDDGERTVIFPSAPVSITGATDSDALESVIALLVQLGLATDDR